MPDYQSCPHMTPEWHLDNFEISHPEYLFLNDRLFSGGTTFDTPVVKWEHINSKQRRPVSNYGYCDCDEPMPRTRSQVSETEYFEPAMIMDRMVADPCDGVYQRLSVGETNENRRRWLDRFDDDVIDIQMDMQQAAARRREWLGAQFLQHSEYTMVGEKDGDGNATYKPKRVFMERDECLYIDLVAEGAAWDPKTTSIKAVKTLFGHVNKLLQRTCGAPASMAIMGSLADHKLINFDDWDKYVCCNMNSNVVMPLNFNLNAISEPTSMDGVINRGRVTGDSIDLYSYDGWHSGQVYDANGVPQGTGSVPYIDPTYIIFIAQGGEAGFDGFTNYGSIIDTHARGLGPLGVGDVPEFVKSREKFANGGRDIWYKSKPFVGALNTNSICVVKVCETPAVNNLSAEQLAKTLKALSNTKQGEARSVTAKQKKELEAERQRAEAAEKELAELKAAANGGEGDKE